jgi:nucleoside 2-deoxyribosyltransferase
MQIYFACSITGGRQDELVYQAIVDALNAEGYYVPTAHLANPGVMALERIVDPVEVYQRDIAWIDGCRAMIAEVSTPSHGVGYEIGYALSVGKPVLCCYHRDRSVSKMLLGNTHPRISLAPYDEPAEAVLRVREFLAQLLP